MGVPTHLPPLTYLSQVHACVDGVLMGGTLTGAAIKITLNGVEVGLPTVAGGIETPVAIFAGQALPPKAVLMASQEMFWNGVMVKSPETPSLPIGPRPNPENKMPAPKIAQPYECDTKVRVTGILDGALLDLHTDRPQGGDNIFHGNDVSFSMLPLNLGEAVTAKQWRRTCRMESSLAPASKQPRTPSSRIAGR